MKRGRGVKCVPGAYYVQRQTGTLVILLEVNGLHAKYRSNTGDRTISPEGFRMGFRTAQPGEVTADAPTR